MTIIPTMNYRNHITIEANKRGGKPCVRGLRITVYEVLEYLASEMSGVLTPAQNVVLLD